jgi:hypothetical protein
MDSSPSSTTDPGVRPCPRCRTRLEAPESGTYSCGHCRLRFEVKLYRFEPQPVRLPRRLESGDQAPCCARHSRNAAADTCARCGDFICKLCETEVEARRYCTPCFERLYDAGQLLCSPSRLAHTRSAVQLANRISYSGAPRIETATFSARRRIVAAPGGLYVMVALSGAGVVPERQWYWDEVDALYEWRTPDWTGIGTTFVVSWVGAGIAACAGAAAPLSLALAVLLAAAGVYWAVVGQPARQIRVEGRREPLMFRDESRTFFATLVELRDLAEKELWKPAPEGEQGSPLPTGGNK